MSRLTLVDPLTLIGRELLAALPESSIALDVTCFHTTREDEHQIGEIRGEPTLIAPLDNGDDLGDTSLVVVCSSDPGPRMRHLHGYLEANPDVAVLDIARLETLAALTTPIALPTFDEEDWPPRLRLAHPALCTAATVLQPLVDLRPVRVAMTVIEPASTFGESALEEMARQAAARIQGEHVHDRIGGEILAFNLVVRDASDLTLEAGQLFAGVTTSVNLVLGGTFHGHLVTLDVRLDHTVDEMVLSELWSTEPDLFVAELPTRLDSVVGSDRVILSPPVISPCGRGFTVCALVDGLRIGGAVSAIRILEAIANRL